MSEFVVAVVVAYNRHELLQETLSALLAQTRPVDAVIVVDNASTDGSGEAALKTAPLIDLVTLHRNTGGAGGFTVGIERAISRHGASLIWAMDDDTIPEERALEELMIVRSTFPGSRLLASRVVWTNGRDHPMNTPRRRAPRSSRVASALAAADAYAFRSASFVSLLIPASGVRARGLPVADYFLWNDDFEYSTRLVRGGRGLLSTRSVVEHRTRVFSGIEVDPGERFHLEVRNKIWLFARSRSLGPVEKVVFAVASAARWVRVFRRSQDRATLGSALLRGVRDGMTRGPRSNAEALAGLGEVSEAIAAFERGRRG